MGYIDYVYLVSAPRYGEMRRNAPVSSPGAGHLIRDPGFIPLEQGLALMTPSVPESSPGNGLRNQGPVFSPRDWVDSRLRSQFQPPEQGMRCAQGSQFQPLRQGTSLAQRFRFQPPMTNALHWSQRGSVAITRRAQCSGETQGTVRSLPHPIPRVPFPERRKAQEPDSEVSVKADPGRLPR
jgi:hypothetical protein